MAALPTTGFRLPPDTLEQLDAIAAHMVETSDMPRRHSRADAIVWAARLATRQIEAERKKAKKSATSA